MVKFGTPGLHHAAGCSAEFQSRGEGGEGGESAGLLTTPQYGKFVSHIDCLYLFSGRGSLAEESPKPVSLYTLGTHRLR